MWYLFSQRRRSFLGSLTVLLAMVLTAVSVHGWSLHTDLDGFMMLLAMGILPWYAKYRPVLVYTGTAILLISTMLFNRNGESDLIVTVTGAVLLAGHLLGRNRRSRLWALDVDRANWGLHGIWIRRMVGTDISRHYSIDESKADSIVERIHHAVADAPYPLSVGPLQLGVSMGYAVRPPSDATMTLADQALPAAKRQGKTKVFRPKPMRTYGKHCNRDKFGKESWEIGVRMAIWVGS
jgi:hypothetical protein